MKQIKAFISYAHANEEYFKYFTKHFTDATQNKEHFEWLLWDDTKIHVGTYWDDEIQKQIAGCNVALLLVSMAFMASKYIKETEFEALKKRYSEKGILIVPILFAPCHFERWEDLGKIQLFKPKGSEYGRPDVDHFTFADLVEFRKDGIALPNPNADRYVLDLVRKIESSFAEFAEEQDVLDDSIAIEMPVVEYNNKLSDYPRPRTYFTGRDTEIKNFKEAIDEGNTLIAIDGPGGIGKTQFTSKCIDLFIPPDKVIWYDCTQTSHLDTLISEAGYPELLKGSSKTDLEKFSAFKQKIQENQLFLFLDNFQETNTNPTFRAFLVFIQEYLRKGCVIVIDRDNLRAADLNPKRIRIEGFKEKQLEYAKALINHSYQGEINLPDQELLNLCNQLYGYPLAIDLAILLLSQGETSKNIIAKIAELDENEKISERLLNAIFERPDSSEEEKDFILQFSIFSGRVTEEEVIAIVSETLLSKSKKKLQQKNLLSLTEGFYQIHPLVREFCYQRLANKQDVHGKAATYYLDNRTELLDAALEEKVFYHLIQSGRLDIVEKEVIQHGRKYVLQGLLSLVDDLIEHLKANNIHNAMFSIIKGDIAHIQGKWADAQKYFESARDNNIDIKIKIEGMRKVAEMLYRTGKNKTDVLNILETAQDLADKHHPLESAYCLNTIGAIYYDDGDLKRVLKSTDEAFRIASEFKENELVATVLLNKSELYCFKKAYDIALNFAKEALAIFVEINDKIGIASTVRAIGKIHLHKEEYGKSLKYFNESLTLSQEIGYKKGVSVTQGEIANMYSNQGEFKAALQFNEDSKRIAEEIGDHSQIGTILNNIGLILDRQNKPAEAAEKYKGALKIAIETGDIQGIGTVSENLGEVYSRNKKHFFVALEHLFDAVAIQKRLSVNLTSSLAMNCITKIREQIGLSQFTPWANEIASKMSTDLRQTLPLPEILKQPRISIDSKNKRNAPCHCGSGKKYKQCHGKTQ